MPLTWQVTRERYGTGGGKSETSGIKTGRAVEYRVVSTGRSSGMERHDPGCRRFGTASRPFP
ncbi:MAG: hypothetical protein BHV80_13695 [Phocaeicola vulgatus]|uniref:Uncharacterized protein n=1 Tax=Phocaeicola vulgatus TaxID=821 RepID=A0A1Q6IWG7_PHOVU|nr:hypothetical protein [Bacteroides uniformis]OKZ45082.1 MAG: hypothetical protein BHV80_13695 [Phocaeicola vulgatus]